MSLNEGDVLLVGTDGSAVLQFANGTSEDDQMVVAPNTTLTFSKLSDSNGTTTKVSMLKGSVWSSVKSIKNKEDEFTLETPTAIMGVRGTNLFIGVNPLTGDSIYAIASGFGVIHPKNSNAPGNSGTSTSGGDLTLSPFQQVTLENQQNGGSNTPPSDDDIIPFDIQDLIDQANPTVIKNIIDYKEAIDKENEQYVNRLREELKSNQQQPSGQLPLPPGVDTEQDLNRLEKNLDKMVTYLLKQAVQNNKIGMNELEKLVDKANETLTKKIDLDDDASLELTDAEKKKLEEMEKRQQEREEQLRKQKEEEELQRKQDEAAQKALELKKELEEANKKALEEQAKKAMEEYERQLSELEKKQFEEESKKREEELNQQTASPSTSASPSPSTGTGSGGGVVTPAYNNPLNELHVAYLTYDLSSASPSPSPVYSSIPMTDNQSQYTFELPDEIPLLNIINLAPVLESGTDLVKVEINGIPAEISTDSLFSGYGINKYFFVELPQTVNDIVITVKTSGSSILRTVTLRVNRPSLPEGMSWDIQTGGTTLPWDTHDVYQSIAHVETENDVSSINFVTNNGIFDTVEVTCACEGVNISGLTVSNLVENKTYLFHLKFNKGTTWLFTSIIFVNGTPSGSDWDSIGLGIQELLNGTSIASEYVPATDTITAQVGVEVSDLVVELPSGYDSDYMMIWDSEQWLDVDSGYVTLKPGLNRYEIFVNYLGQFHKYNLDITRNEMPTGVSEWNAEFANASASPLTVNMQLVAESADYSVGSLRYYAVSTNSNLDDVTQTFKVDGTIISKIDITQGEYHRWIDVTEADQAVSLEKIYNLSQGSHEYTVRIDYIDGHSEYLNTAIFVGEIEAPTLAVEGVYVGVESYYDATVTGPNEYSVYLPADEDNPDGYSSLDLSLSYNPFIFTKVYFNGAEVEPDGNVNGLTANAVNTISVTVYDFTHTRLSQYSIKIYNAIVGFDPSELALDNLIEPVPSGETEHIFWYEDGDSFNYPGGIAYGVGTVTIQPIASSVTTIVGVFDRFGRLITEKSADSGQYDLSYGDFNNIVAYIVVRKGDMVYPTKVVLSPPN
ncbi:FecR domain-containing protein [Cohnella suwonensis]|uniref:FecR domain-containing protein n=1 Tax=Cohnella suwonensis TaxID=696072 RepID=A0ABW0LVX5_9BACL